jgi:hypothetical protein
MFFGGIHALTSQLRGHIVPQAVMLWKARVSKRLPTRALQCLWAVLLTLVLSVGWSLPLIAQIEQQSSRMACCKKGKAHSCCKRSSNKVAFRSAISPCGTQCAAPAIPSLHTATAIAEAASVSLWALSPGASVAARLAPAHFSIFRDHTLYQRPPPLYLI